MVKTKKSGLSRREFLTAAALSAAGFAVAANASGQAFADEAASEDSGASAEAPEASPEIEIFDTDLLIIGGGQGAIAACWDALSEAQDVMLVEKAPFHHGGPTSWSWSCYSILNNPAGMDVAKTTNQPLRQKICDYFNSQYANGNINNAVYQVNKGQLLSQRGEDGNLPDFGGSYYHQFFKYELDALRQRQSFHAVDNTMITDILINDGVCYGAMGIHVPSGKFRVFRSKATVMGTGAPVWMFGWVNTKPTSLGGSDNTGELQHACYRHGIGLAEAEVPSYDFYNYYPRVAFGSVTGMDAVIAMTVTDKDGNLAFPDGFVDPSYYNPMVSLQQSWGRAVEKGIGGPRGGLYMTCEISGGEAWLRKSIMEAQKKYLGVDLDGSVVECVPELFDKGGQPVVDDNMMTEVKGLFDLHGAGTAVQAGTGDAAYNSTQIKLNGAYAGHCAVQYLRNGYEEVAEIDWQPALDEFNRLHELRTRKVEDGIRPHAIREQVQNLTLDFFSVWRDGERCQKALDELDRIREEELPKMCCADQTVNWNKEWRDAIETTALFDLSYISAQATLFREESGRHMYYRSDFPEVDPAWDNCYTLCRLVDGEHQISKETFPTL